MKNLTHRLLSIIFSAMIFVLVFAETAHAYKSLVFYGDSHVGQSEKGEQIYQQIADDILTQHPNIIFHLGDLVNYKDDLTNWLKFDLITAPLRISARYYPVIGNHDAYTGYFVARFNLPHGGRYYSTTYGRLYFIILDSNANFSYDVYQYRWFKSRLIYARSHHKTIIVIFHHPPIASGGGVPNARKLLPLIKKYQVRLVFNGHYHSYERSYYNGTHFLICGGAGGTLYPPEGPINIYSRKYLKSYNFCELDLLEDVMRLSVYDQNLNLIDSVKMHY